MEIRYYNIWHITDVRDYVTHYAIDLIGEEGTKLCVHEMPCDQVKKYIDVLGVKEPKQMVGAMAISESLVEDIFDKTTKLIFLPRKTKILWKPVALECNNQIIELKFPE